MSRIIFNDYVDATLAALFVAVVSVDGRLWPDQHPQALGTPKVTAVEVGLSAPPGSGNA